VIHFADAPGRRTLCGAPLRRGWSPFWACVTCPACRALRQGPKESHP
jgi:hypothetical protein